MGRSQVKYNRTHGRPGTKGRGSGGRGRGRAATEARPAQQSLQPQGDNAWRFENEVSVPSATGTEVDLDLLHLDNPKLPNKYENVENESVSQQLVKGIDMSAMGRALDQLSVSQRLGIPSYLTVDLEVKGVISNKASKDDGKGKSKAAESSSVTSGTLQDSDENEGASQVPVGEEDGSTGSEDDLDSWLDSVIT